MELPDQVRRLHTTTARWKYGTVYLNIDINKIILYLYYYTAPYMEKAHFTAGGSFCGVRRRLNFCAFLHSFVRRRPSFWSFLRSFARRKPPP